MECIFLHFQGKNNLFSMVIWIIKFYLAVKYYCFCLVRDHRLSDPLKITTIRKYMIKVNHIVLGLSLNFTSNSK